MEVSESVERRIVTVLFADLVGFTTLSEQFDAEDVAAIQDRYFATVRETINRYTGTLEKFIGDAAMAVFGVPRARDDDAARAVRAGLALTSAIEQIAAELGLEADALRLRVGVNTGEAVIAAAGPDTGRVTGDTVNTAARLQTAAPPGRVLVGATTALAVADTAELEPATLLELKGKAEPVAARLVSGWRPEPSRDEAMGRLRAPTLGRDAELASLAEALARVAATGAAERWLIVAPPGVGKSRILREFGARLAAAEPQPVLWRTRTRADAVSPFEAVAVLMCAALDATDDSAARQNLVETLDRADVPEMRADVVVDACVAVAYPREAGADMEAQNARPAEERDALFATWLAGMDAMAAGRTQIWLVEDVHWAGGDVLAFLDRATAQPPARGGRLIVATTRPSLLESNPAWTADSADRGLHQLSLGTLVPDAAHELVAALVGNALPRELVDRVVERSDGNPLFIEELLRTWINVGTLTAGADGAWRLAIPATDIALPQTVQSIYAAQLDDLPIDARNLARRASVAGRRFPVGALEPLGAPAADGLAPLRRRELILGPTSDLFLGSAYAYRHALLRDAGYASLARAERARLHVRMARWLEGAAGDRAPEIAEQIATHYAAALASAPALARDVEGLTRGELSGLAAGWYERAGQGMLALSAHDAARQLLKRAIELTADDARLDKARRWERLGDATAFAADMDEGAAAYEAAIDLYRAAMGDTVGENPQAAEARTGLARATAAKVKVMYQQLRFADAERVAADTRAELAGADELSLARLTVAEGMSALGARGPEAATETMMAAALDVARRNQDPRTELEALNALTILRTEAGYGDPGAWQEVQQLARRVGDWTRFVAASTNSIIDKLDDYAATTFERIDASRQVALAHGLTEDAGWNDYLETEAAFVSGDWDRARAAGLRAMDTGERNAYLRLTVRTVHVMVPIAGARGDRAILERCAAFYRSLEGKFEFPDSPYSRIVRPAQDLELAAYGLARPYVPEVEPRLASFRDDPSGPSWSAALDRVFRGWLEAGEFDGAQRALAGLTEAMPRYAKVSSLGRGTYELMRGRLAVARGANGPAEESAQAALAAFRASAAPWWMAKAIRLLQRVGAADDQLLTELVEIERGLGAVAPTA